MNIKPSTTIRQDYNGFSKYCHELDEPVILTRNGEADLVVMSHETYRRMEARIKLQSKRTIYRQQKSSWSKSTVKSFRWPNFPIGGRYCRTMIILSYSGDIAL